MAGDYPYPGQCCCQPPVFGSVIAPPEPKISRRERIATAALQGLLAGGMIQEMANGKTTGGEAAALLAKTSTGFADALIAELDKEDA